MTRLCVSGVPGTAGDTNPQRTCGGWEDDAIAGVQLGRCNVVATYKFAREDNLAESSPNDISRLRLTRYRVSSMLLTRGVGLRGR